MQSVERLSPAIKPFLSIPNLHRVYLDQLPLLDSANPKLWLIALILADNANIAPIVRKVQAALLLRFQERKFAPLPESARQRIATADAETLLVWGERVLDANNLEDVWG